MKQIDGCTMGGPISVVLANIFMNKLENDIVMPATPIFYKRYVDDIYVRRKKNTNDKLIENLNNYHNNIKFTIETNPNKFLDTEIIFNNNHLTTKVYQKVNKVPPHWSSKIPIKYKRNTINTDLHRAKKISSNFGLELRNIRKKYLDAGYPIRFISSVIRNFETESYEYIIPPWLFDERLFLPISLPYSPENEAFSKRFMEKLNYHTNFAYKFVIIWQTRNIKSLFGLKDKVEHVSNIIYQGICTCKEDYIGESDRNAQIRWNEHNKPTHNSLPAKHLKDNPDHKFEWKVMRLAPKRKSKRKILESFYISKFKPTINNQLDVRKLLLFKNGIS